MTKRTLARLECAAQVTTAPITMQSTGSPVMAFMNTRIPGAFSAGARVSSRICSASSIKPRPIATRPMSLMRDRAPLRKATRPMMNSTGATAEMLNDRTWTSSVVPTLAPSMIASAGTRLTRPSVVNELVISAVAVLLCNSAVKPTPAPKAEKRFRNAPPSSVRRSEPNARKMPLWTMCRPHSSNATPPIRSRRTMLPMIACFHQLAQTLRLSPNLGGSTTFLLKRRTRSAWNACPGKSDAAAPCLGLSPSLTMYIYSSATAAARWVQLNFIFRMGLL
jgi:hypothetical protein